MKKIIVLMIILAMCFVNNVYANDDSSYDDFLNENNECILGECKPENCKKFPYTNQPERLQSLYSVIEAVSVCPVAYELYERLKKMYGFKA